MSEITRTNRPPTEGEPVEDEELQAGLDPAWYATSRAAADDRVGLDD